jgi:threonyl-tRNA synthetase
MSQKNAGVPRSAERDHRRLGRELELFSFSDSVGPGLALWHPRGALVRHLLEERWRREHLARGYQLVYSPHVGRSGLWETSGHLEYYRESMFPPMAADDQSYFLKPMNCPFHMEVFRSRRRSYRELPLRYAELGTVYRYERSGVLTGLLRVRGFTQDDAHIFCRADELDGEIEAEVRFVLDFLGPFRFRSLRFFLGTRPAPSVGDDPEWREAEAALGRALSAVGLEHEIDPGGGAFYGPKLDAHAEDSLGRRWQLSTVQLDFNLPRRFGLAYAGRSGGEERPTMLHRALFGSLERFLAILVEHHAGAFPAWLAPVQVRVVPVAERHLERAREVASELAGAGLRVDLDDRGEPVGARVRDAEREKVPYLAVVGDRELADRSISVRGRGGAAPVRMQVPQWIATRPVAM